ncbi:hypothetical protein GCM10027521_02810 [Amycolatopsis cihanbeyliensis]
MEAELVHREPDEQRVGVADQGDVTEPGDIDQYRGPGEHDRHGKAPPAVRLGQQRGEQHGRQVDGEEPEQLRRDRAGHLDRLLRYPEPA